MKLEKDVVREILLQTEASSSPNAWVDVVVEGHTQIELSYHVQLLDEAKLIEAQDLCALTRYLWKPKRLTYVGHEFLDSVRDPEVWRRTKEAANKVGAYSMQALAEVAKAYVKQQIAGIHFHL